MKELKTPVIIIDNLSIIANFIEDTDENRAFLAAFLLEILDLENKCVQLCMRPEKTKQHEFLVRILAHYVDQVVVLENLVTGLADDITGKITVSRPKGGVLFWLA